MKLFRSKTKQDDALLYSYLLMVGIGLVMIYSTSSILAESRFGSHTYFIKNQFIWALMSVALVFFMRKLDLRKLSVYSGPALLITLILLSFVFVMPARNGSHRWLMLGLFTFQPSELFRFLLVYYLAFSLANPKRNLADLRQLIFPYFPIIGIGLALILAEPDLGTCVAIGATAAGIFLLAGVRMKHILFASAPAVAVASFLVFVVGYKKARIFDYVASVVDPLQGSYHIKQAALTLGSGGIFGTGLGEGRQKLFFLPYPHTDFIFAATGEEVGFFGLLVILSLFFFILWRGAKIAMAQPDRFGFLLAAAMTWYLFISIAINIGVVTAILPVTGLALPFLSYGGSSLLMSSAAIGMLYSLSGKVGR